MGSYTALYVNPKTGKSMKSPLDAYIKMINDEKLPDSMHYIGDKEILRHLREHITLKVTEKHRKILRDLIKEKEKRQFE